MRLTKTAVEVWEASSTQPFQVLLLALAAAADDAQLIRELPLVSADNLVVDEVLASKLPTVSYTALLDLQFLPRLCCIAPGASIHTAQRVQCRLARVRCGCAAALGVQRGNTGHGPLSRCVAHCHCAFAKVVAVLFSVSKPERGLFVNPINVMVCRILFQPFCDAAQFADGRTDVSGFKLVATRAGPSIACLLYNHGHEHYFLTKASMGACCGLSSQQLDGDRRR